LLAVSQQMVTPQPEGRDFLGNAGWRQPHARPTYRLKPRMSTLIENTRHGWFSRSVPGVAPETTRLDRPK
jgi:hypothetical protein